MSSKEHKSHLISNHRIDTQPLMLKTNFQKIEKMYAFMAFLKSANKREHKML